MFESKRGTYLCHKAVPSICSKQGLAPCHRGIRCLLPKSRHQNTVLHQCAPCDFQCSNPDDRDPRGSWPPDSRPGASHRGRPERPQFFAGRGRVGIQPRTPRCGPPGAAWASRRPRWPPVLAAGEPQQPSVQLSGQKRPLNGPLTLAGPGPAALPWVSPRVWG